MRGNSFWQLAGQALRYRRLMVIGIAAALLDALCAFSGFGALILVIRRFFSADSSIRDQLLAKLRDPDVVRWIGDQSHLATWLPGSAFGGFAAVLGVIFALTLLGSGMRVIHQLCAVTMALRTTMRLRQRTFQRLVHLPLDVSLSRGTADSLSRIVRDCSQLTKVLNTLMGKAVRDALMGLAMLVWALLINWLLTLIFVLGLPVVAVCIRKFGKRIRRASKYANQAYGGMLGALQESMQGMAVVKVHNAEGYERRRFNRINRKVYKQEFAARSARALSSPVIETIAMAGVIIVSLVAAYAVFIKGQGNPEDVVYVLVALALAGGSFRPLANIHNDIQEATAASDRIQEVLDMPVEPNTRGGHEGTPLPRHGESVVFEDVCYAYPGNERHAVDHVTLQASYGQTVAIVGHNGSGKSTLLNLLPRLTAPSHGRVLIDGHDIAHVALRNLRRQMAVVTQHTVLFQGTIAENIAYGARHTGREAVIAAARAAYAHEFITTLPEGYDSPLGEFGSGLSGGQKQRLAIARAILRDPAILILDEATSQIDADSEAKINDALSRFRAGRTTFVIAHRLSTVVDADLIAVMQDGRIVDRGRHDQLLKRCEVYQLLTRTQFGAPAPGSIAPASIPSHA